MILNVVVCDLDSNLKAVNIKGTLVEKKLYSEVEDMYKLLPLRRHHPLKCLRYILISSQINGRL